MGKDSQHDACSAIPGYNISSRNKLLFIIAALVICASLLIPANGTFIDIVLIISLLFSVLLPIIAKLAKDPVDIKDLPLWVIFVVYSRLGASVLIANAILAGDNSGTIVNKIARLGSGTVAISAALGIVALMSFFTSRQLLKLKQKSLFWLTEIRPEKEFAIQCSIEQGLISSEEFLKKDALLKHASKLFVGICASTRLIICDCALCIATAVVTVGSVKFMNYSLNHQFADYNALFGMIVVSAIPMAFISAASRCLESKHFFNMLPEPKFIDHKVIQVPSKEIESIIDDETSEAEQMSFDLNSTAMPQFSYQAKHEAANDVASNPESRLKTFSYDSLASKIGEHEHHSILLLADNTGDLPLTVPVNVALRLAQTGKKILIIDTDASRNALVKVFDIESGETQGKAVCTCVENVWITPADTMGNEKPVPLFKKLRNALRVFDHVIVYSPRVLEAQHYSGSIHQVFAFSETGANLKYTEILAELRASGSQIYPYELIKPLICVD